MKITLEIDDTRFEEKLISAIAKEVVAVLGLIPVILGLWDELKDYMKDRKNNE